MLSNTQAFTLLTFLVAGTSVVNAHGHVAKWTVGGVEHPGFNPSNAAEYGKTAERPTDNSDQGFADYTSTIVACGGASAGSGLDTWDVNGGDSVTAHWNTWPDSHKGSIAEYMAACPDTGCDGVDAANLKWFKIAEDTFDGSKWPTDTVVSTLDWTFKIPTDLKSGPYLVRHDLLAMHSTGAPQVYPVCFQANLISSGSVVPTETTTFPAAYKINDDFLTWNIYGSDNTQFVPPGPAVYSGGSSSSPAPAESSAASSPSASASVPASGSTSSAASAPASSDVESYTDVASATTPGASEPTAATTSADDEYATTTNVAIQISAVVEPSAVVTSAASAASSAVGTAISAPFAAPTSSVPGKAEMGGAVPPITQNGNRFEVLGGSYNDKASATYAACMAQMNRCKDWANSLRNSEVSAALSSCDSQETTCEASGASAKRANVIRRYAKKGLSLF
ncbi:uncharacterized protein L201_006454 [Kwoniella dendrophila CBS 6074]|uniref:lytic cellulose monooxygenase (C4-dehydrogenating) n=1 Tax=Kwoniella dendrophila CBS 6074 TaxID=1295534 RepID=A0AAX4K2V6_9TREE